MAQKKAKKTAKAKRPAYCVALLNLDHGTERGNAVRAVCKNLGIPVRTIAPENLGDPAGAAVGLVGFRPAFVPYAGPVPEAEFMLMADLPSALMDQLLLAMREADVSVDCKAMVTKFNKKWPVVDLVNEVIEEHAKLHEYLAAQAAEKAETQEG